MPRSRFSEEQFNSVLEVHEGGQATYAVGGLISFASLARPRGVICPISPSSSPFRSSWHCGHLVL